MLDTAIAQRCTVIGCPMLFAELEMVLLRPKFRRYLSIHEVHQFVALIRTIAEHWPDPVVQLGVTPDPKDDYLVALARSADADCLISGDPHLADLSSLQPPVLTPRAFLEFLGRQPRAGAE